MVFIYFLNTFYIHSIHIEGQDEGQRVATRKVETGSTKVKTGLPNIQGGPKIAARSQNQAVMVPNRATRTNCKAAKSALQPS